MKSSWSELKLSTSVFHKKIYQFEVYIDSCAEQASRLTLIAARWPKSEAVGRDGLDTPIAQKGVSKLYNI